MIPPNDSDNPFPDNCSSCHYWIEYSDRYNVGECHRRINITPTEQGNIYSTTRQTIITRIWDKTISKDWCGDYKKERISR